MMNFEIALDFGSANFKVYMEGKGITVNEPAFIALDLDTDEVLGTGREAYQMIGRVSKRVSVSSPFSGGVVADYPMAAHLVSKYIKRIGSGKLFLPSATVSVPVQLSSVEQRALIDVIQEAGIRKISLIREPFAVALGCGVDIFDTSASMVLDIGAEKTTAAIVAAGGILAWETIPVAGNAFDEKIIRYIRRKYALEIGKLSAEALKLELGSVMPREKLMFCHVRGRDLKTDLPKDVTVTSDDMVAALADPAAKIASCVFSLMGEVSASVLADVAAKGIYLSGGSAQIYGLGDFLKKKMEMEVNLSERPGEVVAMGAGIAQKNLAKRRGGSLLTLVE